MRVAVFTDNDFHKVNGVTTTLQALLRWAPPDVRPRIYTADREGVDGPRYLSLPASGAAIPFYAGMDLHYPPPWAYIRHARRDRIDLIHLTTPGPVGIAALWTAWWLQLPIVGSFHTDLATYARLLSRSKHIGRLMGQYLRWPYGRCQRVLVPSAATGMALAAAGVAPGKHVIWRRGVDTSSFSPTRRSAARRQQWGVDDDTAVVVYVGRISREKNLAAFMRVHERLTRARLRHRLVFVGDGPMREELAARLPDAIITGAVPHAMVGEYLASADVFAFPSRTDTAGNVVLEAQAAGLPAVVADEGGPRENVWPDRSAFITSAADDDTFAAAVERLVRDRATRVAMGTDARTYALTRDWPSAFAPLFDTYREAVARRRPADCGAAGLTGTGAAREFVPVMRGDRTT